MSEPKVTRRKITDYIPDPDNANLGNERGLQMIEDSLQAVGAGRSLVADKGDVVAAGNKTLEAAVNAGITDVVEVETDGKTLIVHKRSDFDLSDPKNPARKYAYYDNRASEVSLTWSAEQIAADIEAGVDLSSMWTPGELEVLGVDLGDAAPADDPGAQIDRAEELQAKWQVERGQVWRIGKHRLMCGDSTSADDVAALMAGERARLCILDYIYGADIDFTQFRNYSLSLIGIAWGFEISRMVVQLGRLTLIMSRKWGRA